jgi:hypothetical protein
MRISFDTSTDSKLDMLAGIAALQAYMATYHGRETTITHAGHSVGIDRPEHVAPLFTPGDMSGSASSPADAAPSPIAPEVPQDGVPMPPTVVSVPAPPSTAPVALAAPSTSAPSGDLDVHGLPWDERIHAGTKAKNADGSWRQRRGLNDPALVARVEAETRARGAVRQAIEGSPEMMEVVQGVGQMFAASVPPPPVATVAVTPPAPAAPDALTYDGFLAWVTPKMMDGSTPFDKVAAALSASGVSSLQELRDNPAAIPAVYQALGGV